MNSVLDIKGVAPHIISDRFSDEQWIRESAHVPIERPLTIYINREELVTILCTPTKLDFLVIGFLYTEEIISTVDDVVSMEVCDVENMVDVRLKNEEFKLPTMRTLTSGCAGGVVFQTKEKRVESDLVVSPTQVLSLMKKLQKKMELYRISGGVHASALSDTDNLIIIAEDIGRHNTLDKIQGECLLKGISSKDRILLTTGRISSEMLLKAAKMEVPIVVSRTSPTDLAVSLARDLGIALVGYARGKRLSVYSHPERLGRSMFDI